MMGAADFVLRNGIFGIEVNPQISSEIVDQDFLDRLASSEGYCVRSMTDGRTVDLFIRETCSPEHVIKGSVEACFVSAAARKIIIIVVIFDQSGFHQFWTFWL